jgi:hypothetical protein
MKRRYILFTLVFVALMTCATITSVAQLKAAPKAYSFCPPGNCTSDGQCSSGPCPYCIGGTCHATP